jgi:hypothetical protein
LLDPRRVCTLSGIRSNLPTNKRNIGSNLTIVEARRCIKEGRKTGRTHLRNTKKEMKEFEGKWRVKVREKEK